MGITRILAFEGRLRANIAASLLLLNGCTVVPTDHIAKSECTIFEAETLDSIQEGVSSKFQVEDSLGKADLLHKDGSRWIYETSKERPGGQVWCYVDAVGNTKCNDPKKNPLTVQIIELDFDEQGILDSQNEITIRGELSAYACSEWGICEKSASNEDTPTVDARPLQDSDLLVGPPVGSREVCRNF